MNINQPAGPSVRDWADAGLHVTKLENAEIGGPLYELKKQLVFNGVVHIQSVWLNQSQLRAVGIDHGL